MGTVEAEIRHFLDLVELSLPQPATSLARLKTTLETIGNSIGQVEQELAGGDETALTQQLEQLRCQQSALQSRLAEAQAIGLTSIRQEVEALARRYDRLAAQNLARMQSQLDRLNSEVEASLATLQQAKAERQSAEAHLAQLDQEAEELARREQTAQQTLNNLAQQQHLCQLRQQCLDLAHQIQALRENLQQEL